ncbi:hypothetical protein D3C78_1412390 [compost metagenome]
MRDFYDHEIHIYNHNILRKSSDYEGLPPEIQQLIDAHVAEHEAALQAPIIAQQQAEAEAQQAEKEGQQQQTQQDQQFQAESKQQDHENKIQQEIIKGKVASQLQTST